MKFYFVAGERSGDLHGGNLIRALKNKSADFQFRGFGGEYMESAGMDLVVDYEQLAFMGFVEVLVNLRTIRNKMALCKQDILAYKPDVVVLIDYAGFNMRIAKFAKAQGIRVFWYISPKVWAWNQGRAWKLKQSVDRMFCILPFEKDFFRKFDWVVDYVGNPVLDAIRTHKTDFTFVRRHELNPDQSIVALLPGSRAQELRRITPLMIEVVKRFPQVQFVVGVVHNLDEDLYVPFRRMPNVKLVYNETYDLLSIAHAAIVTSGTATLETALWRVPQVVVYKTAAISYMIARSLIKVPFISLVNLVANRAVVKEMIQEDANPDAVQQELDRLLNGPARTEMLKGYEEVIRILDTGSASANTARLMLQYLGFTQP